MLIFIDSYHFAIRCSIFYIDYLSDPLEVNAVLITLVLTDAKWRHTTAKCPTQGHRANRW